MLPLVLEEGGDAIYDEQGNWVENKNDDEEFIKKIGREAHANAFLNDITYDADESYGLAKFFIEEMRKVAISYDKLPDPEIAVALA